MGGFGRGGVLGVVLVGSLAAGPAAGQPPRSEQPRPTAGPELGFSPRAVGGSPGEAKPPVSFDERARALGLRPASGGGWTYEQEGGRVKATIREDGTVELDVESGVQVKIDEVCLVVVCVDTREKSEKQQSRRRERARRAAAKIATDLVVMGATALAGASGTSSAAGASYANPWGVPSGDPSHDHSRLTPPVYPYGFINGRYGFLPYPSRSVASFLDRTFDFRLDLARQASTQRLEGQAARLPEELLEIWRGPGSAKARRNAVLERWGELAPTHIDPVVQVALDTDIDPARRQAADRARGVIQRFVELHIPADSEDAFTPEELRRFNAALREPDQFWPYGPDAEDD
jgi:hypothetical protein